MFGITIFHCFFQCSTTHHIFVRDIHDIPSDTEVDSGIQEEVFVSQGRIDTSRSFRHGITYLHPLVRQYAETVFPDDFVSIGVSLYIESINISHRLAYM